MLIWREKKDLRKWILVLTISKISIKVILNWWNKGNVTSALNALSMMNDTSIVMDVLNNTFAEN